MEQVRQQRSNGFSITAKLFHWGFILIFAYGIIKQIDNIEQLEDLALLKFEIVFAFLFILFLVVRFFLYDKNSKVLTTTEYTENTKNSR